jgi:hypothetical protein
VHIFVLEDRSVFFFLARNGLERECRSAKGAEFEFRSNGSRIFFLVLSSAIGIAEALTLLLCEGQDEGRAGLFFFLTEDLNVTLTSPKVFGGEIRGACKGPRHGLGRKFCEGMYNLRSQGASPQTGVKRLPWMSLIGFQLQSAPPL